MRWRACGKSTEQTEVEGKATIQRIEITYSDGSVWAMGPPVAKAKTKAKMKNRRDDGVRIMVAWM